jgi:putative transcriptional regulator
MEGVYYSGEREVLEELMAEGKRSDELRLFIGHSGWAPGQLEAELLQGTWDVVSADVFTLFRTEPEQMWEYLRGNGRMIAGGTSAQPETPVEERAGR